jgi:apolipoprotein N-acyltransferase
VIADRDRSQPVRFKDLILRTRARRRFAAALAGAASVLSMAPFHVWPVLWLTLPLLLALAQGAAQATGDPVSRIAPWQTHAVGRAAETGWWFGFGYHAAGLFWIGEAFLVEAEVFAWLLPFAVTLMPAGLALFTAVAVAFTAWAEPAPGARRLLAFALGVAATEWLRGHILTGFPWNVLGYALAGPETLMQSAGLFGIYGLTLLAVVVFAGPSQLWKDSPRAAVALALAPLAAMWIHGIVKLKEADHAEARSPAGPQVRIVQPSVPQREKWRPENQRRIFDDHLALTLTAPGGTIDGAHGKALVVWPEAAMPFLPLEQPIALEEIGRALPAGTRLITGALRAERGPGDVRRVFNSMLAFDRGEPAVLAAVYDKTHLVPFGEYLPFQRTLEAIGLRQLVRMRGGFAAGAEPRPLLDVPGLGRLAPLVCYEAVFPRGVVPAGERPRAMVNVTNDGWFGNSTGPRQHLHMARVRAVEQGLPLMRAANNGISAVVDAAGRVRGRLDLDVRASLDAALPPVLPPPPYARFGDGPFGFAVAMLMLLFMPGIRPSRRSRVS